MDVAQAGQRFWGARNKGTTPSPPRRMRWLRRLFSQGPADVESAGPEAQDAIREILYLDTDRLGSILSQLLGGIPAGGETTTADGAVSRSKVATGFRTVLSVALEQETTKAAGTRLQWLEGHRLLLDLLEELRARDALTDLDSLLIDAPAILPFELYEDLLMDELLPGRFFLLRAQTKLIDYASGLASLERTAGVATALSPAEAQEPGKGRRARAPKAPDTLGTFLAGAGPLREMLANRLLVRSYPLGLDSDHHFVGPLRREGLLEAPEALYLKYGFHPIELTLLGQVAMRPLPSDEEADLDDDSAEDPSDLEGMLDQLFEAFPQFLDKARWPRVTVSPIAVFREIPLRRSRER